MSDVAMASARHHRRGDLLMVLAAVGFSTAGLFARLSATALWPMIAWRNLFGMACLVLVAACLREPIMADTRRTLATARGWMAVLVNALATLFYIAAFTATSVADVAIIYAASPPLAALLAWIMYRERPRPRIVACMALCLTGVAVTVGGSLGHGRMGGDMLAVVMTILFTLAALQMRDSDISAFAVALLSAAVSCVAALVMALATGQGLVIAPGQAFWLGCFGLMSMAIAYPAYLAAVRLLPAGRAMLISTLDLPLAPLWVWLFAAETPSRAALAGGAIILAGVAIETMPGLLSPPPQKTRS